MSLPTPPRVFATPIGLPGEPYRPSNGQEGRIFAKHFCDGCVWDHRAHEGEFEGGCEIYARALGFDVGDEHYPSEWIIAEDGYPACTAFDPDGCA